MRAQIQWSYGVTSTKQYVWTHIMPLTQLHRRLGLAGDGHRKIGETEAVKGEGHSTIGEVEVLFQVE
jgi:hypothetical protein